MKRGCVDGVLVEIAVPAAPSRSCWPLIVFVMIAVFANGECWLCLPTDEAGRCVSRITRPSSKDIKTRVSGRLVLVVWYADDVVVQNGAERA